MHSPTDERHERLATLAGSFAGQEHMPASRWAPQAMDFPSEVEARMEVGGTVLVMAYRQIHGDEVGWASHGVFWIDKEADEVVLTSWDSSGMGTDEWRGGWTEDGRLVLTAHNVMGHWRSTYVPGEGGYAHSVASSPDGESWSLMMEGTYTAT